MISQAVKALVDYGLRRGLLKEEDTVYARNQIGRRTGQKMRLSWRRFLKLF